jgi:hypothetical protein
MKRLIGILAIALLCSWHTAWAAVVMDFTFTDDFDGDGTPGSVTFRLSFDSIADADPSLNSGSYVANVTLLSGGSSVDSQQPVTVVVANDIAGVDTFSISSAGFPSILDVDGVPTNTADFVLTSTNKSMLASDALPLNPLDPNFPENAETSSVTLGVGDTPRGFGPPPPELTIFTTVPEPSAYVLLIVGVVGMLGALRMRRARLR